MPYMIINGELYHYGLKGMKWGTRRWQNADGTFNTAGKERYFGESSSHRPDSVKELQGSSSKTKKAVNNDTKQKRKGLTDGQKKALKVGVAVAGTALAAYGAYKLGDHILDKNHEKQMNAARKYVQEQYEKTAKQNLAYLKEGNWKASREISERNRDIANLAYNSMPNRRSKFDPKKVEAQLRAADRQKANQELVRKMMQEGIDRGGIKGNYSLPEIGVNNIGFDYRKKK